MNKSTVLIFIVVVAIVGLFSSWFLDSAGQAANISSLEAQANYVNAQATALILQSSGQFAVDLARSTQIVADSDQGPVNTYLQGHGDGVRAGTFGTTLTTICVAIIVGLLLLLMTS